MSAGLEPGMMIGDRYRLQEQLGAGAMGEVFAAEHVGLGRRVALKVLHADYAMREDYRARFHREARVTSRLHHPTAVGVHDFGEHQGMLFLAMDLLEGRTLRDALEHTAMSIADVQQIVRAIADCLDVAHALPLVHRDLKPENIMLVPLAGGGERPVIVDFGLAFVADPNNADMGRLTRDGMVIGSPLYMSPEQARDLPITPASDVYALGCVLFEMVAGRTPFIASGGAALLGMQAYVEPPSPSSVCEAGRPKIEPMLDDLVLAMLSKQPGRRPTAAEVSTALDGSIAPRARVGVTRGARELASIDTEPTASVGTNAAPAIEIHVGVWGAAPSAELELACRLGAIGLARRGAIAELDVSESIVLAPEASDADIGAIVKTGRMVIAGCGAGDMPRVVALIRANAADVVRLPLDPVEVVSKLRRAARTRARSAKGAR